LLQRRERRRRIVGFDELFLEREFIELELIQLIQLIVGRRFFSRSVPDAARGFERRRRALEEPTDLPGVLFE
jgi:hypothetical protein